MGNVFRNFRLVDRHHFREVTVVDNPGRQIELWIWTVVERIVSIGHVIADTGPQRRPLLVKAGNGDHVRNIDAADKGDPVGNQFVERVDRVQVERCLRIGIDRGRHAADEKALQMGILAAENGMNLDEAALPVERFEIVRQRHQIGLGRQLVSRMPPIGIGERAELATLHESLNAIAHTGKIRCAGQRPIRDRLCKACGFGRITVECVDDVDPVQRVQMIEMHDVVLDDLRRLDEVS